MTAIAAASLIATTFTGSGGAVSERAHVSGSTADTLMASSRSETACTYDRHRQLMRAVKFYSWRIRVRENQMGAGERVHIQERVRACPRFLALHLRSKAYALRKAHKRWLRRLSNPEAAIEHVFGEYAWQAKAVAWCESRMSVWASNGQYLGLFQMGEFARERYGHGFSALAQARAAFRYFVASGRDWSPWTCKP